MEIYVPPFSPTHQIVSADGGKITRLPVALVGNAFYTEDAWPAQRPSEFSLGKNGELLCRGKVDPRFTLEEFDSPPNLWEFMGGTLPGLG